MKKKFTLVTFSIGAFLILASYVSAQVTATGAQQGMNTFAGLINTFNSTVVKALGTLFLSGAVVAFFFGVTKFIWGIRSGAEKAITDGKQFMIWGLIALFVMFSVYGIIKFAQNIVPGLNSDTITIPSVNYGGSGSGGLGGTSPAQNTGGSGGLGGTSPSQNTGGTGGLGGTSPAQNTGLKANGEQCIYPTDCVSGYCQSGPYGSQCAEGTGGTVPPAIILGPSSGGGDSDSQGDKVPPAVILEPSSGERGG